MSEMDHSPNLAILSSFKSFWYIAVWDLYNQEDIIYSKSFISIVRQKKNDLNDVILDVAKVATAEHGISAVRCVAGAVSALARIQFVVDNRQFEASRVMSESRIKNSC